MIAHAAVWLPLALVVAAAMDFWAALLHGRFWHRSMWFVHKSHHEPREGAFEANDALALFHAPIAMALIIWGCGAPDHVGRQLAFGVGVGMTLFAVGYLIVHDGLVHGRLPVRFLLRSRYLRRVVRAHRVHHVGTNGGAPYGLFFGPWELARAGRVRRAARASSGAPSSPSARRA